MELDVISDVLDRVIKKQKRTSSRSQEVINQICYEIEQALEKILSPRDPTQPVDHNSILDELKHKFNALAPLHQLESFQEELDVTLTKYPKVLEKSLYPDISIAWSNADFERETLHEIISNHFYQQGLLDQGDEIAEEVERGESLILKSQLAKMHKILVAMDARDPKPALKWFNENREKLKQIGSTVELSLRTLEYVEKLQTGDKSAALRYAKTYLAPFALLHEDKFMKLIGCLVYWGRLSNSRYSDLLSPALWDRTKADIAGQFCRLIGHSRRSPLEVAIAAGSETLPTMLKLASVMPLEMQEWQDSMQLPVPVDLSRDLQFHSIFVCPVSREPSSKANPPMQLPCLHVLSMESILKMSRGMTRMFKCPYCPVQAAITQCRVLHI